MMKKFVKILSVILAAVMLCSIMPCAAFAANIIDSGTCGNNLTWTLDDEGTLTISGEGDMTNGDSSSSVPWEGSHSSIKSVVIEKGVTSIGNWAFYCCYSLASVTIPNSVTSIGYGAFEKCSNLASITIPDGVASIGDRAFFGCDSLVSVTIDSSVTSIGNRAFDGCSSLKEVHITDIVAWCEIYFVGSHSNPLYYGAKLYLNGEKIVNLVIPEGVTSIGEFAFARCDSLTSVTIPNSVTSIGNWAFEDCTSLVSVTIPDSVTSIGGGAFSGCESLASVTIGSGVTSIGNYVFSGCTSLVSVTIPNSVTSIGKYAFYYCTSLVSVTIPDSVTSIGDDAFTRCDSLASVTIPNSVTSIGNCAFFCCYSLASITIPNSVTSIGNYAFYNCYRLTDIYYAGTEQQWEEISANAGIPSKTKIHITSLLLSTSTNTIFVGNKLRIKAVCTPDVATYKRITWSSSNNDVAAVDANGYVTGKSAGTAVITAKASNGVTASCEITVSDSAAKDTTGSILDYDKFEYSFGNSESSFGYSADYKIPIERYLQAGFAVLSPLPYVLNGTWGGNCFGMSASSVLFFKDDLKEENYDPSVYVPKDFSAPNSDNKYDKKLREMIELFQVSQQRPLVTYEKKSISGNVGNMIEELDKGNPLLLSLQASYEGETFGHSVVIYGYTQNETSIDFKIYDCSGFVTDLIINNDYSRYWFTYTDNQYDWRCASYCRYGSLRIVYNTVKWEYPLLSLLSADEEPQYIYIIRAAEDMLIINSAGQTMQIANGEIYNDIENASVIPASYLAENKQYIIVVPKDTYTITGLSDEEVETIIADDNMSVSINGISSSPLTISSDLHDIEVQNSAQTNYYIKYTTYNNIFDEMILSGTTSGTIRTSLINSDIAINGAKSISAEAVVSRYTASVSTENLQSDEAVVTVQNEGNASVQIISNNQPLTDTEELPSREKLVTPDYDLVSGEYSEAQTLTFVKDDETIIYYTKDGSIPDENSLLYTAPIDINKSMTITAVAKKYGYIDSDAVVLEYTMPEILPPISSLESGGYDKIQSVALKSDDDCIIYYTTDGSDPIDNGIEYSCEIVITEDTTLKAVAVKDGCFSDVAVYNYLIQPIHPLSVINTLTDQNGNIITADRINDVLSVNLVLQKIGVENVKAEFFVACYDDNNCIVGVSSAKHVCDESINNIELQMPKCENIKMIKILCLDSLTGMKPLLEECIIE